MVLWYNIENQWDCLQLAVVRMASRQGLVPFNSTKFQSELSGLERFIFGRGVDVNDESVAVILADTGGRFIRKPVQTNELVKRVKAEFEKKRICRYCGWDLDEPDSEILFFFHSGCWKEYRKDGLLDPMPENFW